MTDTAPDIPFDALDGASDDASEVTPDSEIALDAGIPEEAAPSAETIDEDGLDLRIEESNEPGTILVAVADPPASYYDHVPPCESEEFRAEQADAAITPVKETAIPVYGDLAEVAAVRLPGLGPALFFLTNGIALASGDKVLVEMEDGHVLGETATVMRMNPKHLEGGESPAVKPILRKANDKDIQNFEANETLTREAAAFCRQCIRDRDLDMKLVDVLTLHDRSKMVFYFTAPARIDFRELVKDLVRCYRTRIELRQIGVRHETQMVGALGNCGMVCCCRRYLRKFAPVAIKMAKEQNVFLNPVKISGICGRLLCCLAYEQDHYDEFYRSCPKLGKKYHTDAGVLRVLRASLFRESVTVLNENNEEAEYPLTEWNALNPFRPNASQQGQGAKKQEAREGSSRPAGEDRNRKLPRDGREPRENRDGQPPRQDKKHGRNEKPYRRDDDAAHDAPAAIIVQEESVALIEDEESVVFSVSQSRTEISFTPGEDDDVEYPADADDDGGGGSIFGLAPKRDGNAAPGGQTRQDGQPRPDGQPGRKRRPHRRHGRKKPSDGEA